MDTKKLIEEVLLDLGNNKSLKDVSSKIQIIVRLLGDEKLKSWYTCEFVTGYKDQELPDYEYLKVIFRDILLLCKYTDNQCFTKMRFSMNIKKHP